MDGHFILKRDNPQVTALQLGNLAPEPVPIVLLGSGSNRVVENANAPLFLDVGPRLRRTSFSKYSVYRYSAIWTDYRGRAVRSMLPFNVALTGVRTLCARPR